MVPAVTVALTVVVLWGSLGWELGLYRVELGLGHDLYNTT